ncbi:mitochondrial carrier protein [Coprinopsis cinerea okayama7|uniref:Mitochondrial carrier protein n=1 Tax=Coprinopsis cinerea (strain Okayama-7 / 130 / ATCC MYA-4618 / FGSC 9003) TaxID=240176 RepID=A8P2K1_COPC7|nr:mitochondrial carrier protein [Coprinopsis cinerea okayama7\|eukprot:XP_001838341.1 mitochondrial carrier protein [Coprinopsis cinerea okayama7\
MSRSADPERQPLIAASSDEAVPNATISYTDPPPSVPAIDTSLGEDPIAPKNTGRLYAFYGILVILGTVTLVLLIKGLIESGDVDFDLKGALKSALGGGLSGAAAMVLQVLIFMPLRTIMNYQYRFGSSLSTALNTLYAAGGYVRFYQGLSAALLQGPLARFGDTAANAGILALLQSNPYMKKLPAFVKTVFASLAAAAFRMILTPIDTVKTTLQAQGREGWGILKRRILRYGIGTMWYGAFATAAATFVGHYPWFGTYNYLDEVLPPAETTLQKLSRRAFIGFVASVVSDTVSNSLRVVKTYRQVNESKIGYVEAAREVVRTDGLKGLLGRGLKTRILANGLQGLTFSILWRWFMDIWNEKTKK